MIIKSLADLIRNRPLRSVSPEATVAEAAMLLDEHGVGALAVMTEKRLVGILSERDITRRCVARNKDADATTVADIMTREPVTIAIQSSLAAAQETMIEGGFRHLPVVDRARDVLGMVSMRDIPTEYRLMVERFREFAAPTATQ